MRRTYRYRLAPTRTQEALLMRFAGARRWVWNWALQRRQDHYQATGTSLPTAELSAALTALKRDPQTAWLAEMHAQSLQQALRDLDRAFAAFFARRARYPRFKSKKVDAPRFRMPQGVHIRDGAVQVPKIGRIKARISRPVEGVTKGATFKRDACGRWFVCIVAELEMPTVQLAQPDERSAVGVDLGLHDLAVLSTGERIPALRSYRAAQRKLRRAQRALARTQKGSVNRARARRRLAHIHQTVANQRSDAIHKLTTRLVRGHGAVCIEDLSVKGLARTKLAKSVHDAAFGLVRQQLAYKAVWYCRHLAVVDRWYPSSKTCHECGSVNAGLTLKDRRWACPECGCVLDRDLNAARNIKREGLRMLAVGHTESLTACGHHVRPPMAAVVERPA